MKQVTLKSITFCNFKGEQERTTTFNPDVTTISGGNGLGKSRHFDAVIWLLSGKDAHDRKDYEIKTRVNGEELHKCECSVTGVIIVDGEEITSGDDATNHCAKSKQDDERGEHQLNC